MATLVRKEVIRSLDMSSRFIPLTATQSITRAAHEGRRLLMGASGAALTFTLPKCVASGDRYYFVVSVVNTSNYVITREANSGDIIRGSLTYLTTTTDYCEGFASGTTSVTVTLDGDAQGGYTIGSWLEFVDIATASWAVRGVLDTNSANASTSFS